MMVVVMHWGGIYNIYLYIMVVIVMHWGGYHDGCSDAQWWCISSWWLCIYSDAP